MDTLFADIKFGLRTLQRNAGYTVACLLTLMLGIGSTTAAFSLVYGILLRPLPYAEPDRLVRLWEENAEGRRMSVAWANFADWQAQTRTIETMAAYSDAAVGTISGASEPVRVGTSAVSRGFLEVLGVTPARGRDFLPEEHRLGADPAVIVSDAFWRTSLGSSNLSDQYITIGTHRARIVGVMPPGFDYPAGAEIWYPLELNPQGESRTAHNYSAIGRLAIGANIEAAKRELDGLTQRFADDAGAEAVEMFFPRSSGVRSLHEELVGDLQTPLTILLGASLLVLLISCTNLASAGLARATARGREFAVRRALGGERSALLRLLLVENLLIAFAGAALGVMAAALVIRVLPLIAPAGLPRMDAVGLHPTVLAGAFGLTLLTALLYGLLPTLRLVEGRFGNVARIGRVETRSGVRVWKLLVATEVALAFVLLVGSVLLIRSFIAVTSVDPGYRKSGALLATVSPPLPHYVDESRRAYYDRLLDEISRLPGVEFAGLVSTPPMLNIPNGQVDVRNGVAPHVSGDYQLVGGEYFRSMGISVLSGRTFDARDHENVPDVVVVSRAFAEMAWPGQDPVGMQMTGGGMDIYGGTKRWATVIGVVDDVHQRDLTTAPRPAYYFSYRQRPFRSWQMTAVLQVRHDDPTALASAVRAAAQRVDPAVPVTISSIDSILSDALTPRRFTMLVLAVFSGVAMLLACVGIWGVVGYAVTRRRREIGIRMALGSEPHRVRGLVQRDYLLAAAVGGAFGLAASAILSRGLERLLFQIEPTDPITVVAVTIALAAATWIASYWPSLRATRISPLETMQSD